MRSYRNWTYNATLCFRERVLWRRRPAGGFCIREVAQTRRRDTGATKIACEPGMLFRLGGPVGVSVTLPRKMLSESQSMSKGDLGENGSCSLLL